MHAYLKPAHGRTTNLKIVLPPRLRWLIGYKCLRSMLGNIGILLLYTRPHYRTAYEYIQLYNNRISLNSVAVTAGTKHMNPTINLGPISRYFSRGRAEMAIGKYGKMVVIQFWQDTY